MSSRSGQVRRGSRSATTRMPCWRQPVRFSASGSIRSGWWRPRWLRSWWR